jgi:hypothetical protein
MTMVPLTTDTQTAGGLFVLGPQNPDSLVKPNGDVVAAMTIQATESVYGVWFKFTVPLTVYNTAAFSGPVPGPAPSGSANLRSLVYSRALMINSLAQHGPITDIRYIELVTKAGLFKDNLLVEVSTPDLESSSDVIVPLDPAQEAQALTLIDAAYSQLTANLALT